MTAKYRPYLTDDGSIGLFSGDVNDVFHSRYGALSEGYEKFVIPANIQYYLNKKNNLNVLDICYGIGYNSKALINYILKKFFDNSNIVSIDSDNKIEQNSNKHIGSIVADNIIGNTKDDSSNKTENYHNNSLGNLSANNFELCLKNKTCLYDLQNEIEDKLNEKSYCDTMQKSPDATMINIEALEYEKEFVFISPCIKNNCYNTQYALLPEVNNILLNALLKQYGSEYQEELKKYTIINEKKKFFLIPTALKNDFGVKTGYKYNPTVYLKALLHNIYYQHITKRDIKESGFLQNDYRNISKQVFNINFYTEDARRTIKSLNKKYDLIFLDAFTPQKLPTLWSLEFFKRLYCLLDEDGILLTYSNSARIRNALLQAGFYIGKNIDTNGNYSGTIASKNQGKILNPLSLKEKGLLQTKSGICYRDEDLNSSAEEILKRLELDINNSNLITSSQYLKGVANEI